MQISQSDIVRVRRARWRVTAIREYRDCRLITLEGLEAGNTGVTRHLLTPFDVLERVPLRTRPRRVSTRLWRRVCRGSLAADTPPASLSCARGARIDLLPHQLEPALALVRGLGSRTLIADEVGLGKTIQAGLIIAELRALGVADRTLVVTPAGLRDQWAHELLTRFGVEAEVLDARALRRLISSRPVGANPWAGVPVAIASVDFIKRPEVLAAARACTWDLLVVDEAHGVAGPSDRQRAVEDVAAKASFVVLLTATPHNGDRLAFTALCGIGAHQGDEQDDLLFFRRTRGEVSIGTPRRVHRLAVRMSPDEARMHDLLGQFSREVRNQQEQEPGGDFWLALSVLYKRALSSAASFKLSVDRRLAALSAGGEGYASQIPLPLGDLEGELTRADEPPGWSPLLRLHSPRHEREILEALAAAAARAARSETKLAALARLLRRVNEPAVVFTEYRDTLLRVQETLGRPCEVLHGGMTRPERLAALERFTTGTPSLLLATDAAGEGLNLQRTCRLVVNLELPWNPMRLEQRIGRVDRIGQTRRVHVVHLLAREAESTVLARLERRIAVARHDVGAANPLGVDDDRALVREILGGDRFESSGQEPPVARVPPTTLRSVSLEGDAEAEANRVAAARTLQRNGDEQAVAQVGGCGPLLARAGRWQTRLALRGRALTVWRVVAADGSGRQVGSVLAGVLADPGRCGDDLRHSVEQRTAAWRERLASTHRAFVNVLLTRERARNREDSVGPPLSQPGLFDLRETRERLAALGAREDAARNWTARLSTIELRRELTFLPPRLLLVLKP
jgi:superfamily II DNA or RNA helicase